jgi:hypothetical protein
MCLHPDMQGDSSMPEACVAVREPMYANNEGSTPSMKQCAKIS